MWPFRRKKPIPPKSESPPVYCLQPQIPDLPSGFGYKNTWWAFPTQDTSAVVAAIELQNPQPANWQTGILHVYQQSVFVAPPIGKWTFVAGFDLPPSSTNARQEVIDPLLQLSQVFGEAQAFSSHRVVGYNVWAKAVSGQLIRGFGYLGESGETFWDEGEMTPEEHNLGFRFFDERLPEAEDDSYWDREDLSYPDEDHVMQIAAAWSISPTTLDSCHYQKPQLGVLGTTARRLDEVRSRRD